MSRLENAAWRLRDFLRRDAVLAIACVLAVTSCIAVPPDAQYVTYIDWRTLGLLFSLMVATSGLARANVLSLICRVLVRTCGNGSALIASLTALAFFTSMVVTNDVALVAFVPLALAAMREAGLTRRIAFTITCMTVAANMGSMLTPIGNPQNIYLQSVSGMAPGDLVAIMAPYSALAFVLLAALIAGAELRSGEQDERSKRIERGRSPSPCAEKPNVPKLGHAIALRDVLPWAALIIACLLCVARIAPVEAAISAAIIIALLFDKQALRHVDYALLLTFAAFFVFIGNVTRIMALQQAITTIIQGHELLVGVAASQLVSNVPAAIMLSGFTSNWHALLVGTNIGGLGTLIASMASLISYKQLAVAYPKMKAKYLRLFLSVNFAILAAELGLAFLIP